MFICKKNVLYINEHFCFSWYQIHLYVKNALKKCAIFSLLNQSRIFSINDYYVLIIQQSWLNTFIVAKWMSLIVHSVILYVRYVTIQFNFSSHHYPCHAIQHIRPLQCSDSWSGTVLCCLLGLTRSEISLSWDYSVHIQDFWVFPLLFLIWHPVHNFLHDFASLLSQ